MSGAPRRGTARGGPSPSLCQSEGGMLRLLLRLSVRNALYQYRARSSEGSNSQAAVGVPSQVCHGVSESEGGMLRLETLIELKFLNSSCASLSSY